MIQAFPLAMHIAMLRAEHENNTLTDMHCQISNKKTTATLNPLYYQRSGIVLTVLLVPIACLVNTERRWKKGWYLARRVLQNVLSSILNQIQWFL